jgi:hypothetical protein
MNITSTPTYPVLSRNSDITYLVTYSVLITIRIFRFIPLPEDFYRVDKTVDKYVPVDMNKQVYESRLLLV